MLREQILTTERLNVGLEIEWVCKHIPASITLLLQVDQIV